MAYCKYDNAFINKDSDNLDKMARKVNKLQNQVNNDFDSEYSRSTDTIMKLANSENAKYAPHSIQKYKNNNLPTPIADSENDSFNINNNYDSMEDIFSDITSEYSLLPQKSKRKLRNNTNHLSSYTDNDDDKVINHVTKCKECKSHLMKLLRKNTDNKIIEINDDKVLKKTNVNIRDIVLLIFIGIFVIILLDFVTK
jgi:hypothetical protein